MNLTVLPRVVSHPDGDAADFDVLHGVALSYGKSGG